ncbi:MAG: hypothetical protein FJ000_09465 [Actinobacteria bacterium]|nr:hypothetical protein [Actinomycetota bacterium]
MLMDGRPQNDSFGGAVCANAGLSMLVTGYETYCESRWCELESEGIGLDAARVLERFGTRDQRERLSCGQDIHAVLGEQVSSGRCAPTLVAIINFQNFESRKRAWNLGYGIRFGTDLELPSQLLERLQRLLAYRHRIVHVSPLIGLLNHPQVPPEDPEFSGPAFLEAAEKTFERFISALHRRTLELCPTSSGEEESHTTS